MRKANTSKVVVAVTLLAGLFGGTIGGCGLLGGLGIQPFGQVAAVQLFDEQNYTVALSVEAAVTSASLVQKINWVFGDGTGFVEGASGLASIKHRYEATGTYQVTAFVFSADALVGQVAGSARVLENPDGTPGPNPTPAGLPGAMTGPNPKDNAANVAVKTKLTLTGGAGAASHDVYLGTIEASVDAATTGDLLGIYRGNQTATEYDPAGLLPDTEYFWRVDERNANGATKGPILSFRTAKAPKQAKDFQPAHQVAGIPVAQVLRWTAGEGAGSHDVYFGKNQTDVMNAAHDDVDLFKGNQTGATFDPNDDAAEIDGQLLPATSYYWRIDEVGLGGTAKGAVLEFATKAAPPKITSPVPADNAASVDVEQSLSWSASGSIESFDVYFGDDESAVTAAKRFSPEFKGNQAAKIFNPGTLAGGSICFWRIDTLNPGGTTKGDVLRFTTAAAPGQAATPTPAHNATGISVWTLLSWQAGGGGVTTSFAIYFGTDFAAVSSGASSALQGSQDVGQTQFDPLGLNGLAADTLYYWRIDAVGPGGVVAGPVWRFRTASLPGMVSDPVPANDQRGVPLDQVLHWTAGLGATGYDVYLGTNEAAVQAAGQFDAQYKGQVAATAYTPSALEGNTDYFWRIDAVSLGGSSKGVVWKFTTAPAEATAPAPLDSDSGIGIDTALSWTAGAGAASHDVYLGTNQAAVTAAAHASPEFKGNRTSTSYDPPGNLDGFTTYYWRIDEVTTDGTTRGDVWSFTTAAGEAAQPIQPSDGATGVELQPTLKWTTAAGATSHDVYLGTGETAVGQATRASAEFRVNQAGTSWVSAAPLDGNTTYYWRIDEVDADDNVTKGAVWQFRTATGQARDPIPANLGGDIEATTSLSWTAGSGATTHRVYLGTNQAAVDAATTSTPGIYKGEQVGTTYTPIDPLTGSTPHYWRIDEVGPAGVAKGEVWKFTTRLGQATAPDPANGATGVALTPLLSWTPDAGALSHDIYFGTNSSAVDSATRSSSEYQGSGAATNFSPGVLNGMTWYYWRIDEVDAADHVTKGTVWQFRTGPGKATAPIPEDFDTEIAVDTLLRWTAGVGAVKHHVYLGTDRTAVEDATTEDITGIYRGEQTGTIHAPDPALVADTTYYWRIDEVAANGTTVTKGDVWRFSTAP
jgi:hypothetical protein